MSRDCRAHAQGMASRRSLSTRSRMSEPTWLGLGLGVRVRVRVRVYGLGLASALGLKIAHERAPRDGRVRCRLDSGAARALPTLASTLACTHASTLASAGGAILQVGAKQLRAPAVPVA